MTQTWNDLLFAHWPVPYGELRPLVPQQLALEVFENQCWVAVTPFHMSGVRARLLPAFPGLSRFPELNVRTYVSLGDKPGVYFFSLDATNWPAIWAARTFYRLPYFRAHMEVTRRNGSIEYLSRREQMQAEFRANYSPASPVEFRSPGTLEHWLTERYCLYVVSAGHIYRGEIHHAQWPLQNAQAEIQINTVASAAQIALPPTPPLLHFCRKLDVLIWPLRKVNNQRSL